MCIFHCYSHETNHDDSIDDFIVVYLVFLLNVVNMVILFIDYDKPPIWLYFLHLYTVL